jgi:hypothetical protein
MAENSPIPDADGLLKLLWRLMRPLVRLAIKAGLTHPRLAEMLRQLYVQVATNDLLTDPKARTDSRVSLLTGVHRKELRRLREAAPAELEMPRTTSLGNAIIARWLGEAPWIDDDGEPRPLPRTAAEGAPSFDLLVTKVTRDLRPRTVLEEWLSQGLVTLRPDGMIALNGDAFVPRPGQEAQLFYFARNLADHISAAVANVSAIDGAPFVDRSVHYDGLSAEAASRLRKYARDAAQRLLVQVNREALRLANEDVAPGTPTERVNLGVYLFSENDEPPEGLP